jgi:hypothetical protein
MVTRQQRRAGFGKGQPSRVLRRFEDDAVPDAPVTPGLRLGLAPDGRTLLTSLLRHRSDIWMLER